MTPPRAAVIAAAVAAVALVAAPVASAAQGAPPVKGTMALEGTMKTLYRGVNVVIVTTMDGVEHAYHFTKDLIVHGGKSPGGVDVLEGLREGSTVVIHYTVDRSGQSAREIDRVGDEGLYITEGRVSRLDRGHKQIAIRYADGSTELFQLTDRAFAEAQDDDDPSTLVGPGRVVVYYRDEHGRKIVHFFRRLPD